MRRSMKAVLAAVAAAAVLAGCATTPKQVDAATSSIVKGDAAALGFDPAKLAAITTAYQADVTSGKIPGAYLMFGRKGQVAYAQGFGTQGPGQTTPASEETIYRIFSMTKPMIAVTAMTLVEEGKIDLDAPVSTYLPGWKDAKVWNNGSPVPAGKPVLVRHLMSHTSGIIYSFIQPNLPISKYWAENGETRVDLTAKAWSNDVAAKLPLVAEPGTAWNYSRGLDVLGGIIEQVTGKSLDAAVKERISIPLGMTDTSFFQAKDKAARFAQPKATDPLYYDYTVVTPFHQGGGGISSTAEDYLRFVLMLANKGTYKGVQILKPETVALMMIDQTTADIRSKGLFFPGAGMGFGLGMSLVIDDTKQRPGNGTFSWNGIAGTEWWYDPKNDVFMVFMQQDRALLAEFQRRNRAFIYDALKK